MRSTSAVLLSVAASLSSIGFASRAPAVTCDAIAGKSDGGAPAPVVYVEGANAVGPFLAPLQQALSVATDPIDIVYVGDGGCLGASNFFAGKSISAKPKPIYYAGQVAQTCDLPASAPNGGPLVADIAASDVYATSCGTIPGGQLPDYIGDFLGPLQPMAFVVPKASTQAAISASAAYFVFGFGSSSGVAPWIVNESIYRRNETSAVQALLAVAIGVPITRWAGVDAGQLSTNVNAGLSGAAAVINALESDPDPEQAVGILAMTNIDTTTASHLDVLAYKDFGQSCAYYPDSTPTAHDKANVRDGHYALWGPIHFFTYVDEHGVPKNPLVARVISYVTQTAVVPGGLDLIQVEAQQNLVPSCAMTVTRSVEMGPLSSVAPAGACGCYYDYVATGASSCRRCTKRSDCPASAPICNVSQPVGFCETQ
ncbi:MAG TPA: hypothetical protein VHC69_05825 [Polyangiaceae bacterium]|nr:hypothetical protein [Polyangiaceae bacterium]